MTMYLEQKSYMKETVKEVQMEQKDSAFPIINGGYPTFNTCNHTTMDMSHLKSGDDASYQHTLSIKLPNDRYVTLCVMQLSNEQVCIDTKFYSGETRAMGFKEGKAKNMDDIGLLAIINDVK